MRITSLESIDFPPFQDLKLDFHETKSKGNLAEVQILTGINGTGKTRILCALAAFLGNAEPMQKRLAKESSEVRLLINCSEKAQVSDLMEFRVSKSEAGLRVAPPSQVAPAAVLWQQTLEFLTQQYRSLAICAKAGNFITIIDNDIVVGFNKADWSAKRGLEAPTSKRVIERILKRLSGKPLQIKAVTLDETDPNQRSLTLEERKQTFNVPWFYPGMVNFVTLAYAGTAYVVDHSIAVMANVQVPAPNELLSFQRSSSMNALLLQQIANIKMQGALDLQSRKKSKWNRIMQSIEESIEKITGAQFAFDLQAQPIPKLSVWWRNSSQPIDFSLLPDGLRSLIGWIADAATMLTLLRTDSADPLTEPCVILLDEPETHLHPEWQRMLLPIAQNLFKNAQIIVATHSPFIACSINEGWIHKLVINDDGTVRAEAPVAAPQGDSFVAAADQFFGIGPDKWYDPETTILLEEFRDLRTAILAGKEPMDKAAAKAHEIGLRSQDLANLVQAEMGQLKKIIQQRKSA